MVKIKCIKLKCPICGKKGSCQVFFNKQNIIKYVRVRHPISRGAEDYNENKKYNFSYCKISDFKQLETLLTTVNFPFPHVQAKQLGQTSTVDFHDHSSVCLLSGQNDSSLNFRVAGPLGFEPRTFSLEG
jgi:hypothetical protein